MMMGKMLKKCLGIAMLCIAGNLHAATVANTDGYDVGSPKGTFSVSGTGAAVYNISIDVPNGGPLVPEIGVCYNSQSKNGLVGYGFNITGMSCITRGHKDIVHDKYIKGIKYNAEDVFLFDGKRLLLQSGVYGYDGSVYSPEGEPFTTVTLHNSASSTNCWFTVVTNNGRTYEIGNSADSRLNFTDRKNVSHTATWYVNKVSDIHGNTIEYLYSKSNFCVRPVEIKYGENTVKSRGITNHIFFNYNFLSNVYAVPFTVGDRQGRTDVCLSSIEVRTDGGEVYRTYSFTYDKTSDGTAQKFYRLKQVDMKNGLNKSTSPIKINWNYLPVLSVTTKNLDFISKTSVYDFGQEHSNSNAYFAADINSDGVSDFVRFSTGTYNDYSNGVYALVNKTLLFMSIAKKYSDGSVLYSSPKRIDLAFNPETQEVDDKSEALNLDDIGDFKVLDYDGDGYNDFIFPYLCRAKKFNKKKKRVEYDDYGSGYFFIVKGRNAFESGNAEVIKTGEVWRDEPSAYWGYDKDGKQTILSGEKIKILVATFDSDGDGRDDVFYLRNTGACLKDGSFECEGGILSYNKKIVPCKLRIPGKPKNIFSGDYNNDGLTDIIVLYDGGYKVFFNNGGTAADIKYKDANSKVGTNFGDKYRLVQGDFDGDGLSDFAFFQGDWQYGLAINNGDGTFKVNEKAIKLSATNQDTNKDDNRFNMLAYDFDHDGKCDFVVSKANYVYHGGFRSKYYYKNTQTIFVRSTGDGFELYKEVFAGGEDDVLPGKVFVGDFTGEGDLQLANFGKNLIDPNDKSEGNVHVYRSGANLTQMGKVASFTDGMNRATEVYYKNGTDPAVCSVGQKKSYPVNSYTLSLPLVYKTCIDNGAAAKQTVEYKYEDAKIHIAGRGFLGFAKVSARNTTLGTSDETEITKWDENLWIPIETKNTSSVGGKTSTVWATTTVCEKANGNYFAYNSGKVVIDFDGNKTETTTEYDITKGVPVKETVRNDGADMYKQVVYSGYVQNSGLWMPSSVEKIQKHKDDSKPFSVKTSYTYDDKGHILSVTDNVGSSLPLTTTNTYDVYGNVLTSVTEGAGVGKNVKTNEYDRTGRFVVKATESATSGVNTFSYDVWGNLLAENDITNPQSPLTVKHEYDGWGREIKTTDPTGATVTTSIGWGSNNGKKYYVMKNPSNGAWEKTWYDNCGREVLMETVGVGNISINRQISYNSKGKPSKVVNKTGKLSISETFEYDAMGRVVSDVLSSGSKTTYSYGNRTVTITTAGKNYTKTTDAWGNVVKSTDPISEVCYAYASCGKPSRISSNGTVTTIEYDDVANQTALNDPDAGRTTYTYAADGKILTTTDARGIKTVNTYDAKGRLTVSKVGTTTIVNTYGTTGNEANRVVKSTNGNKSVEYAYDKYGRVTIEKRTVGGHGTYSFAYAYNDKNQLTQTTYPGGLNVTYLYDDYGFKVQTKAGDNVVYKFESGDGLVSSSSFMGKLTAGYTRDSRGWESNIKLKRGTDVLESFDESYDTSNGNMLSRQRMGFECETFGYDDLDRLVSVKRGAAETMRIEYASDGNIQFKTGVGNYTYESASHPHAVTSVDNSDKAIPSSRLNTVFNDINKIQLIEETGKNMRMDFEYGPDCERWYSELLQNGKLIRATVYADDYEKITENGTTREFYYLDGNAIVIKQNGAFKNYIAFTDNIGNILSVIDEGGSKVFDASYDAWGNQTVTLNSIGLHRGYTGHEMLLEFGIINMNGRLYDPVLGRFLSPDNYVQSPYNSQNFNRYSYCLNNPLKYNDPSGNFIDTGLAAVAIISAVFNMADAAYSGEGFAGVVEAGIISLAQSAVSYGIGQAFGTVGNFGHELLRAGAHGISGGFFSMANGGSFGRGFASGAISSGVGSFAQATNCNPGIIIASSTAIGGFAAWATGGSFIEGAIQGLNVGLYNHAMHDGDGKTYRIDADGTVEGGELPEVTVSGVLKIKMRIEPVRGLKLCPEADLFIVGGFRGITKILGLVCNYNRVQKKTAIVPNSPNGQSDKMSIQSQSNLQYDSRLGEQLDPYHNFPYSFDKVILKKGEKLPPERDGTLYRLRGNVNGVDGYYGIKINDNGKIYHRQFMKLNKSEKMY